MALIAAAVPRVARKARRSTCILASSCSSRRLPPMLPVFNGNFTQASDGYRGAPAAALPAARTTTRSSSAGFPEAAQGFHQQHARVEPAPRDVDGGTLVGQGGALRGHHVQVPDCTALIALHRQIELMLRGADRQLLYSRLLGEYAQSREIILHFLE